MKKLLRNIGSAVKKVVRVVAKPFKKIMGFMGRLGWVGTLAMMFAMPYLASFWGSMTSGMSSFIGGTGAGGTTAATAATAAEAAAVVEGAAVAGSTAAANIGAEAGKATIKGALKSSFASGTGAPTGLFAGNAASKALGYTLKSFQVAASGISNVYSSLTDLVTGAIDGVTGGSLTRFDTWVGDRFNEARSAMGMKTSEGWTPSNSETKPSIDAKTNVNTGEVVKPIESADARLKASNTVGAGELTDQSLDQAGIGPFEDTTREDLLKTERNLLDAESSVIRQSADYADLGTMTITGNRAELLGDMTIGGTDDFVDVDQLTKNNFNVDTSRFSTLPPVEEELSLLGRARQTGSELWRGKYEPQPVYAKNPDGSYVLDAEGNLAPPIGQKDVFQSGLQDYVRNPEKILEKGFDYSVSSAREFLNPQRVIQKEIDDITGLNPQAQVTYVENTRVTAPIADLDSNTGILPDLPGVALTAANHMNNINNNKWFTSASMFDQQDDYAAPGYYG